MDDAAVAESAGFDEMLHHEVVGVGVDAEIAALAEAEVEAKVEDAMRCVPFGDAVNGGVGLRVVEPMTFVNDVIGGFLAGKECKGAHNEALLFHYIAYAAPDVGFYLLCGWMSVGPLARVAAGAHLLARFVEDGQQPRGLIEYNKKNNGSKFSRIRSNSRC